MTEADVGYVIGTLLFAYSIGFVAGYLMYVVKRASDFF